MPKILLALSSFVVSFLFLGFCAEAAIRIQQDGFFGGIKSFFTPEPPYSVLGTSNWVVYDPVLGYRYNTEQPEVNTYSMREDDVQVPKPAGTTRILILGDSIPVTGDRPFVDLLKTSFSERPGVEVLNASVPGYTTYQERKFLENYLLATEPDIVVLSYCTNDNHRFLHKFDEETSMLWTNEAKQELAVHTPLDLIISKSYILSRLKASLWAHPRAAGKSGADFPWDDAIDMNTAWKDYSWTEEEQDITDMHTMLAKQHARLVIVSFPLGEQLRTDLVARDYAYVHKPQQKLADISSKLNVPYLDLFPVFYSWQNDLGAKLYTDGLHLSAIGHQISAGQIHDFLLSLL